MSENFYMSLEDRAYSQDARVTAAKAEVPEGVPFHYEVCDLCSGRGKVVNPSIDCQGITAEDFDRDPDFAENYTSGMYDIVCPRCDGRTTVPVANNRP